MRATVMTGQAIARMARSYESIAVLATGHASGPHQ